MSKETCSIERYQGRVGQFLSIKPRESNPQETELTFATWVFSDPLFRIITGIDDSQDLYSQIRRWQREICPSCGCCKPRLERISDNKFRIIRSNYSENDDFSCIQKTFSPKKHNGYNVCVIDDHDLMAQELAKRISNEGYHTTSLAPHAPYYSDMFLREFVQMIMEKKPDALVIDKGLGFLSGLEVIKRIRESEKCVKSIMLTGEPETDESKRVNPDLFFEKPINLEQIFNGLQQLLQISA